MKRLLNVISAFVFIALISVTSSLAQPGGPGRKGDSAGPGGPGGPRRGGDSLKPKPPHTNCIDLLGLTDAQKEQMKAIRSNFESSTLAKREEMKSLMTKARELRKANDKAGLDALKSQLDTLRSQIDAAHKLMDDAMRNIFTDAQKAILDDCIKNNRPPHKGGPQGDGDPIKRGPSTEGSGTIN